MATQEQVNQIRTQVRTILLGYMVHVDSHIEGWLSQRDPVGFRTTGEEIATLGRELSDGLTSLVLLAILGDPTFLAQTTTAARVGSVRKLRSAGRRKVQVTLLGGGVVEVKVPYLKPDLRGRRGRKRKSGRRRGGGRGLYPALAALGIWFGVTPAAAAEISQQVVSCDSVRAARQSLERRGLDLGHKQTLRIVNKVGTRAVEQRDAWLKLLREGGLFSGGALAGKRVVVAVDGGRLRLRKSKSRGRKRKNGHRGFNAPWREPKLLTIYVIDHNGRLSSEFRQVLDGTMENADALFDMLVGYLKVLSVHEAERLVVLGDGAGWIWNRVEDLMIATGINPSKVVEIIDFYHAAEKLGTIADIPRWSKKTRSKWLRRAERLLRAGHIEALVMHIRGLAVGRRSKKVRAHIGYFEDNPERMRYLVFKKQGLPLGSGAIESAVRRVVNLRMKGNAKYWLEENAEHMLLLRSYLKAGRFDDLFNWSLCDSVRWWTQQHPSPLGIPECCEEVYDATA